MLILFTELTLTEPYLAKVLFDESCGDDVMVTAPSTGYVNSIPTKPLPLTPVSSALLPSTHSHLHASHESLGDIRGSHPSFDPYCAHPKDMTRKIA